MMPFGMVRVSEDETPGSAKGPSPWRAAAAEQRASIAFPAGAGGPQARQASPARGDEGAGPSRGAGGHEGRHGHVRGVGGVLGAMPKMMDLTEEAAEQDRIRDETGSFRDPDEDAGVPQGWGQVRRGEGQGETTYR